MSRTRLNLVLGACAVVLVGLAAWQLLRRPPPAPVADRSEYVLRDYELVVLDDAGKESFTVTGPHLFREPGARSLLLEQPRFAFPSAQGRWNARSDTAWVSPGAEEVQLRDQVEMIGPVNPSGQRTRFATDRLSVFPGDQRASTADDQRVTVEQGDSILQGLGLAVDMQAKRFQLKNDVKGRYAPRR